MHAEPRLVLRSLVDAALAAVAPDEAVLRHLRLQGRRLNVLDAGERIASYNLDAFERILVLGAGKGAAPMAEALERLFGDRISGGLVSVKYGHGGALSRVRQEEAGHPVPDAAGAAAAGEIVALARRAETSDLVLCVFTGGASALTPALAEGVPLADLQSLTASLLRSGAAIHEINTVRKHLSTLTGGNLARAAYPAAVLSLIVSDVVGDELDVIASGPTVPDPSTFADALAVLDAYGLRQGAPVSILHHLKAGAAGRIEETPKPGDPVFDRVRNVLVASNRQALEAAASEARKLGFVPRVLTFAMQGEAREKGRELVAEALRAQAALKPGDAPLCLLAGGETTVTLRGAGKGGRNQEMALAALVALERASGIHMVCVGTDGTDGPTEAAGGFASGGELAGLGTLAAEAAVALDDNDSHPFLDRAGCLVRTGPTRTNVMDLVAILVEPPAA